jgi:hypothetical protein
MDQSNPSKPRVVRFPFLGQTIIVPLRQGGEPDKEALDNATASIRAASNILTALAKALMPSEQLQPRIGSEQGANGRD